ncbi:MAG: M3 family metallopeptidase [Bacteroidetes bacterium]|uniref:M3 family metallopeptidase n=1 Tax=Candidatus Cryptobacteroides merdigallinarum TaxID=2840770 RepID=A0A9D9HEZ6_9BACT|nr:M3 family metallopeptidase [Candidatus Cryptobacteroides merdigallinarum]
MGTRMIAAAAALFCITSCNMENPLLTESSNPYGAPAFDKIRNEHYLPAFKAGIEEAKAEIDAIVANPDAPDFRNTIEALEYSGRTLDRVSAIFYNLMEADTDDRMQEIAEEISPLMTEYSMYVSLNKPLFERVKAVYMKKDSLGLATDQERLLEETYRSFARNGANLSDEDKEIYSGYAEELSLATLQFSKNVLAATNAYTLHITDSTDLAGLPGYVVDMAALAAKERGLEGWVITLDYPSFGPFMKFSSVRDLRKEVYTAYMTRAVGGEYDNTGIVKKIVDLRIRMSDLLGYGTYAEYALEEKMAKTPGTVNSFLKELLDPSLPYAEKEVEDILAYAKENGFGDDVLQAWDFSYWSEKYREARYALNEEQLKPYFRLESCIAAAFDLANRLYGLTFTEMDSVPVYHKDVKVYDVKDADGNHKALFYADFFPRASKRGGAWMTEFRGQSICNGVEERPFISIVTNFTKPTETDPSLLTHGEFTTLLHEFGHSLHGILAEGRYPSQTGTSVPRDFVELPSQIMENWAFEPEFLDTFAKDYRTGEVIPDSLVRKIVASKNYLAGYSQVRQLQYGIMDMAWHTLTELPEENTVDFEAKVMAPLSVVPAVPGTAFSPSFSHIFAGGYAAGYYSYKWSEVLEADAFSLFKEKGIFSREVAASFRDNILSRGSSEDVSVLYRKFRGHDPEPEALMEKLGLTSAR